MAKKRIYSLDVCKVLMAYVVALFHMGLTINPTAGVCVDIFAMISGFFLAKRFYAKSFQTDGYTAWDYTLDHAKSIYPHYLLGVIMLFLYIASRSVIYLIKEPSMEGLAEIGRTAYNLIPDLALLQSAYHFHNSLNYPTWTLSAFLIAGYFIYALLCWNESVTRRLILPASVLMGLSVTYQVPDLFGNHGVIYLALIRAFGPMSLGALTWYFTTTAGYEKFRSHRTALNLFFFIGLAGMVFFGNQENIYFITAPIMLLVLQEETAWINRLLNRNSFRHFGQLSLALYVNHAMIERFVKARIAPRLASSLGAPVPQWQLCAIFLVLLTVYSIFTMFLVNRWNAHKSSKGAV